MDPLSISFGIAGVLPLIAKVITTAQQYIKGVAHAKKLISALILELEVLQSAVTKLEDLLTSQGLADADIKFDQTSVLLSCAGAIEAKLQELFRTLVNDANRKMGRFLWPLTEKEHQKTMAELRNFSTWIQFALSVDGCRLLSQTADNVVAVLAQQLDQFKAIQQLDAKTTELFHAVQKQTEVLEQGAEWEGRKRVLDWISTARYDARHAVLQRARTKNTGSWLQEHKSFMAWRDGVAASRVLWCHGIQGSGKTMLACAAIDTLRSGYTQLNAPLAYYYFDYQDHKAQTPLATISCILRQLLEQLPELPVSAKELYETRSELEGRQIPEYERLTQQVAQNLEAVYIVFDALDECDDLRYMLQLIDGLSQISSCRVLVTSRPHVYESLLGPCTYTEIKIEAQEEDIKRYVLAQCDAASIYQIADESFVAQLVDKLTRSASGMFLLPVLQLRTVLNEPTIGEMEDKLEQLTDILSDAFAEILSRIERLPGSRSRLAMSALMHLAHARRLFQATELSDVLALRPDTNIINPKYRPTSKMILECCQGLVMLDDQTGQLRLAHYAIQEYLVSNSVALFPRFEAKLAFDCLNYLLLDDFKNGPRKTDKAIKSRLANYPFLSYASAFWGSYVRPTEIEPEVWNKLFAFYRSPPAMGVSVQILYYEKGYHRGYCGVEESMSTTPLHHAAVNCLEHSIHGLFQYWNINEKTAMGTTPVIKAASNGHVSMVKLLLDRGADPRISNWYGDALQCAAEAGECETIRHLVEWGMDPSGEDIDRSPVSCAMDRDYAHAVELLADLGADLQLEKEDEHRNTFLEACHMGCERTVDMMLRRGWTDIMSGNQAVLAMRHATVPILRRLISAGVNVNGVDRHGHTALWHARQEWDEKTIQILRDAGATLGGNASSLDIDMVADPGNGSEHPGGSPSGDAAAPNVLPIRTQELP